MIVSKYVERVLSSNPNCAAIIEYPVGASILLKELEEKFTNYGVSRIEFAVMKSLSHAYTLSADVIIVENPVSLGRGRAWKIYPSTESYRYLEGSRITIAEAKTGSKSSDLKSGIGQLIMYSKIICMELETNLKRDIPISMELIIPVEERNNINPLINSVCDLLHIRIVLV